MLPGGVFDNDNGYLRDSNAIMSYLVLLPQFSNFRLHESREYQSIFEGI